jgi:hypothetical protein
MRTWAAPTNQLEIEMSGESLYRAHNGVPQDYFYFLDTLRYAGSHVLALPDEDLEMCILEEFDGSVISFFHPDILQGMEDASLIDSEITRLAERVHQLMLQLPDEKRNAVAIRSDAFWTELLSIVEAIRGAVTKRRPQDAALMNVPVGQ